MSETVLIVEDSAAERLRLEAMLMQLGYAVIAAADGAEALRLQARTPGMLVISDWSMPGLSGLELCQRLRDEPALGRPYVILLTARSTPGDLVTGISGGADDYVVKPFGYDELRVRVEAGLRVMRLRRQLEERNQALATAAEREAEVNRRLHADLGVAARMQRELLPQLPLAFTEVDAAISFQAASTVAGDGINLFALDERYLAFYQLDVAGHGIAPAMLSFTLSSFLSPQVGAIGLRAGRGEHGAGARGAAYTPPEQVVAALNRRFQETDDCDRYFTMVYGVLDVASGLGRLCQAGHPHPLMVRAGGQVEHLGNGGFPVGLLDDATYAGTNFQMHPGDRLVLHSDGVSECTNAAGEMFTAARLVPLLQVPGTLDQVVDGVEHALRLWRGPRSLDDDCSLLAVGWDPGNPCDGDAGQRFTVEGGDATRIPVITQRAGEFAAAAGLDSRRRFELEVVLAEALNNIAEHALDEGVTGSLLVEMARTPDFVELACIDHGRPMTITPPRMFPAPEAEGGRGWPIIYAWTDAVDYRVLEGENRLTLRKSRRAASRR